MLQDPADVGCAVPILALVGGEEGPVHALGLRFVDEQLLLLLLGGVLVLALCRYWFLGDVCCLGDGRRSIGLIGLWFGGDHLHTDPHPYLVRGGGLGLDDLVALARGEVQVE